MNKINSTKSILLKQVRLCVLNHPYINNYKYIPIQASVKECVGIKTAALLVTLWISYGHPVRIKRAGSLFGFHLSITLTVIWISRTVAGSNNWILLKESLRVSKSLFSFYIDYLRSKVRIRINIISVETSLSIIIVAN